uniref:BHLH domain-containing protein n=1 Tax=Ciona savignyi TaxID=51511 RepID=H2ZHN1_CIOSA
MQMENPFIEPFNFIIRKRINSSLDKLRTLLPHSVNIRKDMASLLEQTVEYINIMHTVLNEDKPACLNKVYISYRQKTEEIENFRKSLKKNVASNTSGKRMKSEPGNSSWGQSFTNYGQQPTSPSTDIDQYMKHACMPPTYYDAISTRMGTHPWSHQKMQDSIFPPQANYSGQSQGGLISIPMQSGSSTSRSVFYPSNNVPVKQYDGSFTFTHIAENGEITESQKSANASVAKSESWQTVGQSGDRQNKPINTAVDMGTGKIITNNQTIAGAPDWYRGMYGGPNLTNTPQCNKNAPVKPQSPLFDETTMPPPWTSKPV